MATKKTYNTLLSVGFVAIIALSAILISSALSYTQLSSNTNAQSNYSPSEQADDLCSMSVSVYIDKIDEQGNQVPLNLLESPEIDPAKWFFADSINLPPYSQNPISFTSLEDARYDAFVSDLSFKEFPSQSSIYANEQNTVVQLFYQPELYDIVSREIRRCSLAGSDQWLCNETDSTDNLSVIENIPVKCGMELEFGWVVQKNDGQQSSQNGSISPEFTKNAPVGFISTDLNNDGVTNAFDIVYIIESYGTNDPLADINKDGKVNILDYTIVVDDITSQSL